MHVDLFTYICCLEFDWQNVVFIVPLLSPQLYLVLDSKQNFISNYLHDFILYQTRLSCLQLSCVAVFPCLHISELFWTSEFWPVYGLVRGSLKMLLVSKIPAALF